jgi:predicted ATPase
MLIDYSITNYRSFREKQTLSLIAAPRLSRKENLFKPEAEEVLPELLKVAVIYGPNASGKSNLLRGLDALRDIAIQPPTASKDSLPVTPFRFDPALVGEPSEFELNFIAARRRFRFKLAATPERIVREQLVEFMRGRETALYDRIHHKGTDRYTFGEQLEGGTVVHEAWQRLTSPQRLFLAQAVANSNEELQQLRAPLAWFENNLLVLPARSPMSLLARGMPAFFGRFPSLSPDVIASFVHDLDIPITQLEFEDQEKTMANQESSSLQAGVRSLLSSGDLKALLTHRTALGEAKFKFQEESEGTQNLIGFFWIWWMLREKLFPLELVSIDELDTSLHPQIVARLIKQHLQLKAPRQLIFTTHDTHLMDTRILRRDQIWLTERDINGATQLRSVHDFEGRESEDVEKRYYEGRYRGLPILRES